ncbi:hypothetical protein JCM9279_000913 [Rhodotorula babjevae]
MAPHRFTPALGQTTIIPIFPSRSPAAAAATEQALFFTLIPSNGFVAGKTPEVWTSLPRGTSTSSSDDQSSEPQWHAVPFSPSPHAKGVFVARVPLVADRPGSYEYTYRLRADNNPEHVEWLGSEGSNGRVEVVRVDEAASEALETAGEGWQDVGEGAKVWKGALPVDEGERASSKWGGFVEGERWREADAVVFEQTARTWIQPRQLSPSSPLSSLSTSFPAQLLLLRSTPTKAHPLAQTLALLPFSTPEACSALYGDGKGGVELRVERDADDGGELESRMTLAYASGAPGSPSLRMLLAAVGAAARSAKSGASPKPVENLADSKDLLEPKPLALCTWNALSAEFDEPYTASSLLAWLDALLDPSTSGSPLASAAARTVLLDDGWQDTAAYVDFDGADAAHGERRALRSFQCAHAWYDLDDESPDEELERMQRAQAAKELSRDSGFAGSPVARRREIGEPREGVCVELREVVRRIKERGIERVGVWMTLAGYWDGIHPEGALADVYTLRRVELRHAGFDKYNGHVYLPAVADLAQYYRDYFSSLAAAGIDFVKVDDQILVDSIYAQEIGEDEESEATADAPGTLRAAMLDAMRAAAVECFGEDGIIHCMASSPRHWGGVLERGDTVRTSDDFFPNERDAHRWHVANNAFASLLASQALGLEPDFDMVQSARACEYAGAHLTLRAFSTAQVFNTDPPPRAEDGSLADGWDALLATTKRGVRVLQARAPGVAGAVLASSIGADVLGQFEGPSEPLKVGLPVPSGKGAHIGVWDCAPFDEASSDREVRGALDEKDVADALEPLELQADELVLFAAQVRAAVEIPYTALNALEHLPRALAKPLASVVVTPRAPQIVTVAKLFSLAPTSGQAASSSLKVACIGLVGKTVGLAALRSIAVGSGSIPQVGQLEKAADSSERAAPAAAAQPSPSSSTTSATSNGGPVPPRPDAAAAPASTPAAAPSSRPLSPRSSLPAPQGRLSFLLAYFASAFYRSPTADRQRRTPRGELAGLAQDALRSPLRTLFGEVRALVGFGWATVLWAVGAGQRSVGGQPRAAVTAGSAPATVEGLSAGEGADEQPQLERAPVKAHDGETLRIELDYVGRLGLYVSLPSSSSSATSSSSSSAEQLPIRLALDGAPLDALFVRSTPISGADEDQVRLLVEVDLGGAWNKAVGSRPAPEAEAERAGGEDVQDEEVTPWVVEVQAVGAAA